jgi:biotin carboxyl carrier protein
MRFKAFDRDHQHDVEVSPVDGGYRVVLDGVEHRIDTVRLDHGFYSLLMEGRSYELSVREGAHGSFTVRHGSYLREIKLVDPLAAAAGAHLRQSGRAELTAVMPGRVLKVMTELGQEVHDGQPLIVLEAMKMENEVCAPRAGRVSELSIKEGDVLETGAKIAVID